MSKKASEIAAWLKTTKRQVRRDGKETAAIIHRRLDFSCEAIWSVVTEREKLLRWFGEVAGDLEKDSTIRCEIGVPHKVTSRILGCERPHKLLISWWYEGSSPDYVDEVELRLMSVGENSELCLEHRSIHGTDPAGVGPGWENWLFRLTELLNGQEDPRFSDELEVEAIKLWNRV